MESMLPGGERSAVSNAAKKYSSMQTGNGPLDLPCHLISPSRSPLEVSSEAKCLAEGHMGHVEVEFKCLHLRASFLAPNILWARDTWALSNDSELDGPSRTSNPWAVTENTS